MDYQHLYPSILNIAAQARIVRDQQVENGLWVIDAHPSMAAEDVAFMREQLPGC